MKIIASTVSRVKEPYGATLVSRRMCLSLRSWGSGRFRRCFSRELRRSVGDAAREVSSTVLIIVIACLRLRRLVWKYGRTSTCIVLARFEILKRRLGGGNQVPEDTYVLCL